MAMSPIEMETILTFLMGKLSEDELTELDGLRTVPAPAEEPAMDSSIEGRRRQWLALPPKTRIAVRNSRTATIAADSAASVAYAEMFPHANRLK